MNTKLTLSLKKDVISLAKDYAKKNNVSLSSLVENYLLKIVSDYQGGESHSGSIVEELSGIISLANDVDYQKEHSNYLIEKYK